MALVIRGSRAYEYRSVRRGGRVTSEYVGGGSIPAESAAFFRSLEAGRRAEREADRAEWEAERRRLDEAERHAIEADAPYDELTTVAMLVTGHHRPQRGRWRRRRTMANKIEARGADAPPLATGEQMNDLLDRIDRAEGELKRALQGDVCDILRLLLDCARGGDDRALPPLRLVLARAPGYFPKLGIGDFAAKAMAMSSAGAKDCFLREVHLKEIGAVRDELAGPNPTALERLLAERVALAWFDANQRDISYVEIESTGISLDKAEYLSRQRSRATARFLAAAKALATVRKLALPVLQVNLINAPANAPAVPGGRRRHLACDPD